MDRTEVAKVENYLRRKFANAGIRVVVRPTKDDSAEVLLHDEFIGVLFRDEEDGELSFDFHMTVLEIDLE